MKQKGKLITLSLHQQLRSRSKDLILCLLFVML